MVKRSKAVKVSVCMIMRNEEELLRSAIESTRGLADEVVIVDTGSTDDSVEVARELGATVVEGGDRMHKAQSRNLAAETATGDWVVVLDADEVIADPVGMREYLEFTEARAVFVKLTYMEDDRPTLSYPQMRCWRKGAFEYQYRAHEVPVPTDGWGKTEETEFVWEHRPPKDRGAWKLQYTLERLLLDVEEHPEAGRPLYYLGRQYMYLKEWEKGVETLQAYLETSGKTDRADAWGCLAACYGRLGNKLQQIKSLHQACAEHPLRREWWGRLAEIYHNDGDDVTALGLLKHTLEIPLPTSTYATYSWHGAYVHDLTARCLWKLKRYEEGYKHAVKAYELEPDNERIKRNLLWFKDALGDVDAPYQLHGAEMHANCPRHETISSLVRGPNVLDVGCGSGDLLLLLQEYRPDWKLAGTDVSRVAIDMAKERGVTATLWNTNAIPFGLWNTIVVSQVLEHVTNDVALVEAIKEAMSIETRLIVSVPYEGRIPSPGHKREYTVESLHELLSTIGDASLVYWSGGRDRIIMVVQKE